MKLPKTRTSTIVVRNLKNEVLIYDLQIHKAYNLNETSAIIYNACDGETEFSELKRRYKFTDDLIHLALDELNDNDLLINYESVNHFRGLSRREAFRKVGFATIIALPIITSLVVPRAVDEASCGTTGQNCTFTRNTQSNCCSGLRCVEDINDPGHCDSCASSGAAYVNCSGFCSQSFCDSHDLKNRCCNTGSSTNDGSFCRCP